MLKSNSKQVKEKIQNWLLNLVRDSLKDYGITFNDITKPMSKVNEIFKSEKNWEIVHYGRQRAFYDWQTGLCSALPAYRAVLNGYDMKNKIMEWLEESEEDTKKYDDEKIENFFLYLVYREFEALIIKEEKNNK